MDLSAFAPMWQTATARLSTSTDECGIVLEWLESSELAEELGLNLVAADDVEHGPRFEVRRAEDGPAIFSSDRMVDVAAFLDGVSAGRGGA